MRLILAGDKQIRSKRQIILLFSISYLDLIGKLKFKVTRTSLFSPRIKVLERLTSAPLKRPSGCNIQDIRQSFSSNPSYFDKAKNASGEERIISSLFAMN